MVRFSKETFVTVLLLGLYPLGVLSTITMTGPSSAVANSFINATWTSAPNDPASFKFEIDWALNSLQQSDSFFITQFMNTAAGSATFQIPEFAVGTHRIEVSSNDGSTIYSESSIEIVSVEEPFETDTTATVASVSSSTHVLTSTTSSPPPPPPPSPPSWPKSTPSPQARLPVKSSSSSQSSSSIRSTSSVAHQKSASASSSPSLSPSTSSSSVQSSASQSQTAPSEANESGAQVVTHHNNVGAIAGGAAGGTVVVLLVLLGLWYLRRRRRAAEIRQFLAVPFLISTGGHRDAASEVHRGTDANNYAPSNTTRAKEIITSHANDTQLLENVHRLGEHLHIVDLAPPQYSG